MTEHPMTDSDASTSSAPLANLDARIAEYVTNALKNALRDTDDDAGRRLREVPTQELPVPVRVVPEAMHHELFNPAELQRLMQIAIGTSSYKIGRAHV